MKVYRRLVCLTIVLLCAATSASAQQSWLAPPPDAKILKDVQYAKAGDESLLMDIIVPRKPAGKKPVVVWIHGGGWRAGSRSPNIAAWLAKHGYVVATIDYRLTGVASFPAQIWDCKAAIRFLRAHAGEYDIDGGNIGVWGASAGGHLAALLGTSGGVEALEGDEGNLSYSSLVQAVVDFFGPTDLTTGAAIGRASPITALLGGKPEMAKAASPATYIDAKDTPTLIVHGDKDGLVLMSQSESFYKALRKAGVEAKYVKVKNAGHGFRNDPNMKPSLDEIAKTVQQFFDKHLK